MNLLFTCIKIFFARILDVTIATIRQNVMLKGRYVISTTLAFFEILLWFLVAREALVIAIESPFIPISYALGYASGTLIGSVLSKMLIKGYAGVQIIIDASNKELVNALKLRGYDIYILNLENENNKDDKILLFLEINTKNLKKLEKLVLKHDSDAFITISDTKKVCNGSLK